MAVTSRDGLALLAIVRRAAEASADVIRDATPRRASLDWREKGVADFVTEVDLAAELRAMEVIAAAEPDAVFLAEETASTIDAGRLARGVTFVLDPLDGTTNFIHGFPEYGVSIAAVVDGKLTAGVILNVPRDETFLATAGGGAWLGDERLSVSNVEQPERSLIGTGFPFKDADEIPAYVEQMSRVMAGSAGVRRPGAASVDLASVAAGRLDGFWENSLAPWDVAAGILLVREAGGICTSIDGSRSAVAFGSIVAGNPAIHAWLLQQLID